MRPAHRLVVPLHVEQRVEQRRRRALGARVRRCNRPQRRVAVWPQRIRRCLHGAQARSDRRRGAQLHARRHRVERGPNRTHRLGHVATQAQHLAKAHVRAARARGEQLRKCDRRERVHRDARARARRLGRRDTHRDSDRGGACSARRAGREQCARHVCVERGHPRRDVRAARCEAREQRGKRRARRRRCAADGRVPVAEQLGECVCVVQRVVHAQDEPRAGDVQLVWRARHVERRQGVEMQHIVPVHRRARRTHDLDPSVGLVERRLQNRILSDDGLPCRDARVDRSGGLELVRVDVERAAGRDRLCEHAALQRRAWERRGAGQGGGGGGRRRRIGRRVCVADGATRCGDAGGRAGLQERGDRHHDARGAQLAHEPDGRERVDADGVQRRVAVDVCARHGAHDADDGSLARRERRSAGGCAAKRRGVDACKHAREQRDVDLVVGCERQSTHGEDVCGDHVGRKAPRRAGDDGCRGVARLRVGAGGAGHRDERHKLPRGHRGMLLVEHGGVCDARLDRELVRNFAKLNALAIHLDLAALHAPEALDAPVGKHAPAVAGAVRPLAAHGDEPRRSELGRADVPVGDLRPANDQLADRAGVRQLGPAHDMERCRGVHGADDGAARARVDESERVADRALGRTVRVYEAVRRRAPRADDALVDHVAATHEPLAWRDVAGAHEGGERRGQVGHRDAQRAKRGLEVGQEHVLGRAADRKAGGEWEAHLKQRHVEPGRRKLQQARRARVRQHAPPREDRARKRAMRHLHALGLARAPARKEDVGGAVQRGTWPWRCRRAAGRRERGRRERPVETVRGGEVRGVGRAAHQRAVADGADHVREAFVRQRRIERHVRLARLPRREQRNVPRQAALQVHVRGGARAPHELRCKCVARRVELRVRERARGERRHRRRKGDRLGVGRRRCVRGKEREKRVRVRRLDRRRVHDREQRVGTALGAVDRARRAALALQDVGYLAHEERGLGVRDAVRRVHELEAHVRGRDYLEREREARRHVAAARVLGQKRKQHVKERALHAKRARHVWQAHKRVPKRTRELRVRRAHVVARAPAERHRRHAGPLRQGVRGGAHAPAEHDAQRRLVLASVLRKQRRPRVQRKRRRRDAPRRSCRTQLRGAHARDVRRRRRRRARFVPTAKCRARRRDEPIELRRVVRGGRAEVAVRRARDRGKERVRRARRRRAAQRGVDVCTHKAQRHGIVHGVVHAHAQGVVVQHDAHRRPRRDVRDHVVRDGVARCARAQRRSHGARRRRTYLLHERAVRLDKHGAKNSVAREHRGPRIQRRARRRQAHVEDVEALLGRRERRGERRLLQRERGDRRWRGVPGRRIARGATPSRPGDRGNGRRAHQLSERHGQARVLEARGQAHRAHRVEAKRKQVRADARRRTQGKHVAHDTRHGVLRGRLRRGVVGGGHIAPRVCRIQLGKRAAVQLARDARKRQVRHADDRTRHHVRAHARTQCGVQRRDVGRRQVRRSERGTVRDERDEVRLRQLGVREQQRRHVCVRASRTHRRIDLVELDARAAHLDLRVAAAPQVLGAGGAEARAVARRVRAQPVGDKERRVEARRVPDVPRADVCAGDAQLAGRAAQRVPARRAHEKGIPTER